MSCHVIECGSCARYDCRRQRRAVLYTSVIRERSTMSGSTASVSTTLSSLTHLVSLSRPQRHQSHLASHSGTMIRLLHRCIALMWALMQGIFQDLENGGCQGVNQPLGVPSLPFSSLFPFPSLSLSSLPPFPLKPGGVVRKLGGINWGWCGKLPALMHQTFNRWTEYNALVNHLFTCEGHIFLLTISWLILILIFNNSGLSLLKFHTYLSAIHRYITRLLFW